MAGVFTVKVTLPDTSAITGSFFASFFEWIARNKAPLENDIKKLLSEYAQSGHRALGGRHYQNQTGRLSQSTRADGDFGHDLKKAIELYVDLSQAPYGEFVIDGHGSWDGDPFIDESWKVNEPKVTQMITVFINRAVAEFNRRK